MAEPPCNRARVNAVMLVPAQIERKIDKNLSTDADNPYQAISDSNSNLLPGQQVSLQLVVPAGITASNIQWTIPNKSFKSYVIADDGGTATLTQLQTNDLSGPSIAFYWADSGVKQVKCTFTIFGQQTSVTANLKVLKPTIKMNFSAGSVQVVDGYYQPSEWDLTCGKIDPHTYGIDAKESLTLPTGFSGGEIAWVQLVSVNRQRHVVGGVWQQWQDYGADTEAPTFIGISEFADSPYSSLDSGYDARSENDAFNDWLIFLPPGLSSQWVTFKTFNWNWYGYASLNGQIWQLTNSTNPQLPTASDTSTQPTWIHLVDPTTAVYTNE